jgi:Fe-S oxidoreductase
LLDELAPWEGQTLETVFNCQACGACDVGCKLTRFNLEPLAHNIALKERAVELGNATHEMKAVAKSLSSEKTMLLGKKQSARTKWAKGLGLKDLTKKNAEYAFFPGCQYAYDAGLQQKARSYVEVLKKAGVDIGYLGSADMCCGGRAKQMGLKKDFEKEARTVAKAFSAGGVQTVVTPCSDCYHAFKRQYALLGIDVKVIHAVELIADLIKSRKLKLKKNVDLTVTYHDPCHLGRLGEPYIAWDGAEKKVLKQVHTWEPARPRYAGTYGVYDAPREILAAIPGVRLIEMERIRENSWCCGAGGGCSVTNPEYSGAIAGERVSEAEATGAEAIVTACPWCELNLAAGGGENMMEVVDIIDLVARAV